MKLPRAFDLPVFPWDTLAGAREKAAAHPEGLVDLSVGTPVDDTPAAIQEALRQAANAPGYPAAVGSRQAHEEICAWFARARAVRGLRPEQVICTIGSKELVASLPFQLGVRAGDTVGYPAISYPTYEVGARSVGAAALPLGEDIAQWPTGEQAPALVWLNSPGNPDGHVLSVEKLRQIVAWARREGAVVVADECYAMLAWEEPWASQGVPCLLDERVTDGDMSGLLVAYSLSKQSNLAGYREAFLVGDEALIAHLREIRKHWGLMPPGPTQAALVAALREGEHVARQREIYGRRRRELAAAIAQCGLENDPASQAGLYLWVRSLTHPGWSGRELVERLAELGILGAPGDFYGPGGAPYMRLALTASDADIAMACKRLIKAGANF